MIIPEFQMRKITIQLNNQSLTAGDVVDGHVLVTSDKDFQCERLFVILRGREFVRVVIHIGNTAIVYQDKCEHIDNRLDLGENLPIPQGESRYEFSFPLPSHIPGSYKGQYATIEYTIEAKAEISRARDLKSKQDITMEFKSVLDAESVPGPKSDFIENEGISLVKADITRDQITLGNGIDFRFYVDREAKMRGIRAEIISVEHVEPEGNKTDSKKTLAEIYYPDDEIRRDSWIEATLPTEVSWVESFTTDIIKHTHILKITLDVARRRDKDIEIPIVLTRLGNTDSEFDF
jgi:hypothetical protein